MGEYSICTNYFEILSGTANTLNPAYMEAAANADKATPAGLSQLKNFITSIETVASKDSVKDERIAKSRGNIKKFSGYESIKAAIDFLHKNLSGNNTVKNCTTVFDSLENYQSLYTDGYEKNVRLIILEYENAVYMLVTALSMVIATDIDVVTNGTEIRIKQKSGTTSSGDGSAKKATFGVIPKTMADLARQMSNRDHKEYLEYMLKAVDGVGPTKIEESAAILESTIGDTLDLLGELYKHGKRIGAASARIIKSIKNSIFGIVPLIRAVIYLRYKKKADSIIALDQQVAFIQRNIEQLQNIKTMDPEKKSEIIKKQQAVCEQYKKKAEKLRAELCEGEKDAATEIKKEDPKLKETDDDFVLENGQTVTSIFMNHEEDADDTAQQV